MRFIKPLTTLLLAVTLILFSSYLAHAQMRQVYIDNAPPSNKVYKLSFYSASQGYVAFRDWVGYTADSGRNFSKKYITAGNVNYNGYNINSIAGFTIKGVKAFNQNNIIVYGDYGLVPAILYSTNGGSSFTLSYYSQFNSLELSTGITDMIFPENTSVGYAIDADRILKTIDKGVSWFAVRTDVNSCFDHLDAVDNNTIYAVSDYYVGDVQFPNNRSFVNNKMLVTTNAGANWQTVNVPSGQLKNISLLSSLKSYLTVDLNLFYTANGGTSWTQKNNPAIAAFYLGKIKFVNDSTGYSIAGLFEIKKTTDSGKIWERIPSDNSNSYLYNDLHFWNNSQLWAGGEHGFLELNTNPGGATLPEAFFTIDTSNVFASGIVKLKNYSKPYYQFEWFKNNILISTAYNTTYIHDINKVADTIKLVVKNGTNTDTLERIQYFDVPVPPLPVITSFTPTFGQLGSVITITGNNLGGASSVKFGGTPASSFNVVSNTRITAVLGMGTTGSVSVTTPYGTATRAVFTSLTPTVTSFTPTSGGKNSVITITGTNFTQGGPYAVRFGGVPAASFSIQGDGNTIYATVGGGASGYVTVQTNYGKNSLPGFIFIPPPVLSGFTPAAANEGATVTISGTNLTGATSVKFGGIAASSFTIVSATTITAIVGAGASGYITVSTPRGADSLSGFTYTSPTLISFAPAVAGTAVAVEITGTNFTGVTAVSFGGIAAASFIVNSSASITAVVGAGASGSVTITSLNGSITKPGFVFSSTPIISSIIPASGPVGTVVQINGTNFSTVAANNIVWFGAVKAVVSAASANVLTVTVPAGATYQPLTVTSNGLVSNLKLPFLVTFPGGQLTPNTYATKIELPTRKNPKKNVITDLDGDGLPDMIIQSIDSISIFKNNSSPGIVSFASRVDLFLPGTTGYFNSADIDRDGKPDIVLIKDDFVSVLKNTSSTGSISFAPIINLGILYSGCQDIAIGDISGDGKPDIVLININNTSVLVNTSVTGTLSFAAPINLISAYNHVPYSVTIGDFDMDGRPDIAVSNYYSAGYNAFENTAVSIYRNTYINNTISFALEVNYGSAGVYSDISSGDMDGDGKPEIIYGNVGYYNSTSNSFSGTNSVTVLKNNCTPGNIAFNPQIVYTSVINGNSAYGLAIGNSNGDLKPDVAVVHNIEHIGVIKNISSTGIVLFDYVIPFNMLNGSVNGNGARRITMADLDADSKPELIICNLYYNTLSIFKNQEDTGIRSTTCAGSNTDLISNLTGTTYQWQVNTGTGFVNITDNTNYTGTLTQALHLVSIPAGWAGYQYRCKINAYYSNVFTIRITNNWTGNINNAWENPGNWSCGSIPDSNTDVVINSGTVVVNSTALIRSLAIKPTVILTITTGNNLTVLH